MKGWQLAALCGVICMGLSLVVLLVPPMMWGQPWLLPSAILAVVGVVFLFMAALMQDELRRIESEESDG